MHDLMLAGSVHAPIPGQASALAWSLPGIDLPLASQTGRAASPELPAQSVVVIAAEATLSAAAISWLGVCTRPQAGAYIQANLQWAGAWRMAACQLVLVMLRPAGEALL